MSVIASPHPIKRNVSDGLTDTSPFLVTRSGLHGASEIQSGTSHLSRQEGRGQTAGELFEESGGDDEGR